MPTNTLIRGLLNYLSGIAEDVKNVVNQESDSPAISNNFAEAANKCYLCTPLCDFGLGESIESG